MVHRVQQPHCINNVGLKQVMTHTKYVWGLIIKYCKNITYSQTALWAVSLRAKRGNPGKSISVRLCRTTFFYWPGCSHSLCSFSMTQRSCVYPFPASPYFPTGAELNPCTKKGRLKSSTFLCFFWFFNFYTKLFMCGCFCAVHSF